MQLRTLIWRELVERPAAMVVVLLVFLLGVAALVAVLNVTDASEKAVACALDALGVDNLLPEAKVVTITQEVRNQAAANRVLSRIALGILAVLVLLGGASMHAAMDRNVHKRRREIGTLLALGATPGLIFRLFLGKAALVGLLAGLAGAVLGSGLAFWLGPPLARAPVQPLLPLALAPLLLVLIVAMGATYLPARRASRLDPCLCLREA